MKQILKDSLVPFSMSNRNWQEEKYTIWQVDEGNCDQIKPNSYTYIHEIWILKRGVIIAIEDESSQLK